jgi:hypothetical protein
MKHLYSWLLLGLVAFDTALTLIAMHYGAAEANPFMAWMIAKSIFLFMAFKMGTVVVFIGVVQRSGKLFYIKFAFWAYLIVYVICVLGLNCQAATQPHWNQAVITTYAKKFEGRRMANGRIFHHKYRYLACRGGSLGSIIELRYGRTGRSVAVLADRGTLRMHKPSRWQFDVSKAVAKDLGLYNRKDGRMIRWKYIRKAGLNWKGL